MKDTTIPIGTLTACIDGDARYTDTLQVLWLPDDRKVRIVVTESSPSGGRDSASGPSQFGGETTCVDDPTPASVLKAVKRAVDDGRYVFKRYGKPTKNFRWEVGGGTERGLSLALVKRALDAAREAE